MAWIIVDWNAYRKEAAPNFCTICGPFPTEQAAKVSLLEAAYEPELVNDPAKLFAAWKLEIRELLPASRRTRARICNADAERGRLLGRRRFA